MGASVATGDLMWAAVTYQSGGGGNISGLAGGGTWSQVGTEVQLLGPDVWLSLWKAVATSSAAHTVTATFNVSRDYRGIFIGAFTGNDASGTVNVHGSELDSSTSAPSVSLTPTVDGCLLLGVSMNNNAASAVAGSGYSTVVAGGDYFPLAFEWKEQATAGATVVDYTSVSGTPSFAIHGVAFEPVSGGGPATLEQEGFRWYADDGSESGSTALAAQDTGFTLAAGEIKRLRTIINATGDPAAGAYQLEYRKSGEGTWLPVSN